MVIDIVEYTAEQFASMQPAKLQKICNAQLKKNALLRKLQEDILTAKQRLTDNGVFASTLLSAKEAELTEACQAKIQEVREALLFSLRYAGGTSGGGADSGDSSGSGDTSNEVPYPVDYALSEEDRMIAVRSYYETAYSDPTERFNAFAADTFARNYLGEMYAPLYHYFEAQM